VPPPRRQGLGHVLDELPGPEQALGADADRRSDLYAFGIMIFQLLLGETPFHADTPAATLMVGYSNGNWRNNDIPTKKDYVTFQRFTTTVRVTF